MRLIEHIHHDWAVRVPHLLRNNRYRGWSRPSYALLCFLYHVVKSSILLCLVVIKFFLWDMWIQIFRRDDEDYEDEEDDLDEEEDEYEDPRTDEEELPFCQLFTIGEEMCLLVDHVEMCPDETAFIRVVDDEGYTPLYKRKIRRDKKESRFIVFSGRNYYLDDRKTQPTVSGRK